MSRSDTAPRKRSASPAPPSPETDLHHNEYPSKGTVLFVENTTDDGTWLEIDDQHVCSQEDYA